MPQSQPESPGLTTAEIRQRIAETTRVFSSSDFMKQLLFPSTTPVRELSPSSCAILRRLAGLTSSLYRLIVSHDQYLQELRPYVSAAEWASLCREVSDLERVYFVQQSELFGLFLEAARLECNSTTPATSPSESCTESQSATSSLSTEVEPPAPPSGTSDMLVEPPAPRVPPAELFEEKPDEGVGLETYEPGGERPENDPDLHELSGVVNPHKISGI